MMSMRAWRWLTSAAVCFGACPVVLAGGGNSDSSVAAYVGDQPVTLAEVDAIALGKDMKMAQALYDARMTALDQILLERAFKDDAAKKGISIDAFITQRVTELTPTVSDEQVEAFYNQNQARMRGQTLEQMSGQIRNYLQGQNETTGRTKLVDEAKSKLSVRVVMDVPRVQVPIAPNDPSMGSPGAPVTVVAFSDFQCPFCSRAAPTLHQIEEAYGEKVRVVFRNLPLGMHNRAEPAAEAADCANAQGKFWDYHDKLFANQRALNDEDLKKYATEIGLDADKFNACYDSHKFKADVEADAAVAASLGVSGTPAFFVNGRFVSGAQPIETFKTMIDEELARKGS